MSVIQKLQIRSDALETIEWETDKKEKWNQVLTPDYMSSQESEEEMIKGGQARIYFRVKPLSWERKELKQGKRELDEHHLSRLGRRAQLKRARRV